MSNSVSRSRGSSPATERLTRRALPRKFYHPTSRVTPVRVAAVLDILARHPYRVIWSQKAVARALAARLADPDDTKAAARMHDWLKKTGLLRLADCVLRDPTSGHVQGLADPDRLAACLPRRQEARHD